MKLWPFSRRSKPPPPPVTEVRELSMVGPGSGGWMPLILESFSGAWQRGVTVSVETALAFSAVRSCTTLIASDVAKMRPKLVQRNPATNIWTEVTDRHSPFLKVLRKPNQLQTRIQFFEEWLICKLSHGNTYVLKARDERGVVSALHILAPTRVTPLLADDGEVFYQVRRDNIAGLTEDVVVPASEIIHDRLDTLYHPLCGVSPIYSCAAAVATGTAIARNSAHFFANSSNPGGVLTAPGKINQETADRLKTHWEQKFRGGGAGQVALLGDGLKFERMAVSAVDAQLIEQLKWSAETVASCYHVPPFMIGAAPPPPNANVQALTLAYYTQALQRHIEAIEVLLDEGLHLPADLGVEFDLDALLRMDTQTLVATLGNATQRGIMSPNEARAKLDLPPVEGGETPYLQEQNWPLKILAGRPTPTRSPTPPSAEDAAS